MILTIKSNDKIILTTKVKNLGVNQYNNKINIEFDSEEINMHFDLDFEIENNYKIIIE